jgi:hypothetical protein
VEGWLVGLFTLLGVLAGGLFTYLGLWKQLKQQKDLDTTEWRRKISSEPLFGLRTELAKMASKQERLVVSALRLQTFSLDTEEEKKELQSASEDWKAYYQSGDLLQKINIQYDVELRKQTEEILNNYEQSAIVAMTFPIHKDVASLTESIKTVEKNRTKIVAVQDLINKHLKEL